MLDELACNAWNPGIQSQVPKELLHFSTIFREANVFTSLASALELKSLTGFGLAELVAFRPERLALHELLIRITANLEVPDGSTIADLGINFRTMASRVIEEYLTPQMPHIVEAYQRSRDGLMGCIEAELKTLPRSWGPAEVAALERRGAAGGKPLEAVAARCLARVMAALFAQQGRAWGGRELIASIALTLACNEQGSRDVGETIEPILLQAAAERGYRLLPRQEHPVVINTKGPSASGKSTLRPMQKRLAGDIGVDWRDFALISPDIWRKQLLDYASLGDAYKYAGAFTAEELQIVDQKLDRYMAQKHRRGGMSHLLIDRFRFDSFAPDSDEAGSNLLTRFGQLVYLYFVITPPEMLVERAWNRGLEVGRYKAVDDTLAHAVEAYSGIPDVFFTWVRSSDKRIRFEFLDNTVRLGERPYTVAFGDNRTCNLLDVKVMLDIRRYARIDVNAGAPPALYRNRDVLRARLNADFLKRCVQVFRTVNFADQKSGRIYLTIESGVPTFKDGALLLIALSDPETYAGIEAVAPAVVGAEMSGNQPPQYLQGAERGAPPPTLGQWGRGRSLI
ncbi:MAG TPA: hypothetical protein VGI93_19680 [Steroidobacteraceae bacterium]|jgi:hypothetical protein